MALEINQTTKQKWQCPGTKELILLFQQLFKDLCPVEVNNCFHLQFITDQSWDEYLVSKMELLVQFTYKE